MRIHKIENPDVFRENICGKLKIFVKTDKNAINLERGVYNWVLKEATNKKVVKKWDNPIFVQIYLDHLRSIYINLKNDRRHRGTQKLHQIDFGISKTRWTVRITIGSWLAGLPKRFVPELTKMRVVLQIDNNNRAANSQ